MKGYALGLVESLGYVGAVEAADVCLKAANISLIGCELVTGGFVTIKIAGEVGAVKAAVDAAEVAVKKVGKLVSTHVIPRPSTELYKMLDLIQKEKSAEEAQKEEVPRMETAQAVKSEGDMTEDLITVGKAAAQDFKSEEALRSMKVVALRTLARQIPDMPIERNDIKFAKKEELVDAILSCYRREEN